MAGSDPFYRSDDGDVVDEVVWRHYRRRDARVTERVLEANPGLAAYGPVLPAGVLIRLPHFEAPAQVETVRLWT